MKKNFWEVVIRIAIAALTPTRERLNRRLPCDSCSRTYTGATPAP